MSRLLPFSFLLASIVFASAAAAAQRESCNMSFDHRVGAQFQSAAAERGYRVRNTVGTRQGEYYLQLDCHCVGYQFEVGAQCEAKVTLSFVDAGRVNEIYSDTDFAVGAAGENPDCVAPTLRLISAMPVCGS